MLAISLTILTPQSGVNWFNDGLTVHKETYYNLNMKRVVDNAHDKGLMGEYWVREDGVKMFGTSVIVAANQNKYPYGSCVYTSKGRGIVLDTGTFAEENPEQYDIAVEW